MSEKQRLFNTEMVLAILDGIKTQTRRVVKAGNHTVLASARFPVPWTGRNMARSLTIKSKYRKAREAWTGRVEVEKSTWLEMRETLAKNQLEIQEKDKRIEALREMLIRAEAQAEHIREETYQNVAAGIRQTRMENVSLRSELSRYRQIEQDTPALVFHIRKEINEWMDRNGLQDPGNIEEET